MRRYEEVLGVQVRLPCHELRGNEILRQSTHPEDYCCVSVRVPAHSQRMSQCNAIILLCDGSVAVGCFTS